MSGPRQEGIRWQDLPRERQRRLLVLIGLLVRQRLAASSPMEALMSATPPGTVLLPTDKVQTRHRDRHAVVYVRQSTMR